MTHDDIPARTIAARTARNRARIADLYDGLPADLLATPSLCAGWDLRDLLGHVVMPLLVSPLRLAALTLRHGSVHRASSRIAHDLGRRPVRDLTHALRSRADHRSPALGVGPMGQFADGCIHLRDAARPIGSAADVPAQDWRRVLEWLPSRAAGLGHVPRGLLDGLSWRTTDMDWSHGSGPPIYGAAEAIALAMTGRPAVLPELDGPGLAILRPRLTLGTA